MIFPKMQFDTRTVTRRHSGNLNCNLIIAYDEDEHFTMVTERHRQVVDIERQGGGTAISGGGTPDTNCGTPFRPVPAEFNHWKYIITVHAMFHYRMITSAFSKQGSHEKATSTAAITRPTPNLETNKSCISKTSTKATMDPEVARLLTFYSICVR